MGLYEDYIRESEQAQDYIKGGENVTDKQMEELERLAAPLVAWLAENFYPYTSVVINEERVALTQELVGIPAPV